LKTPKDWLIMILRFEIDGIEYFINTVTFEVGLSISGLARLCGVDHTAIVYLLDKLESLMSKIALEETQTQATNVKSATIKSQKSVVNKTPPEEAQTQPSNDKSVVNKTPKVKSKGGRPKHTEEDLPECLKFLLDGDIYLDTGNQYKNATVVNARASKAILYYYAAISDQNPEAAVQLLWQILSEGFQDFVYDKTGWHPPTPKQSPALPPTRAEELGIEPRYVHVKFDRHIFYNDLLDRGLTAPMHRVYLYFTDCNLVNKKADPEEVSKYAQVAKHSLYDLIERMRPLGLVPEWFEIDESLRAPEAQIRARLHQELGGQIEVQTIHGPIDLLTETELIEIKKIEDWKEGFGQVLAKCKTYPNHQKRLHLFGNNDRALRNIKACCKELDIVVSYEESSLVAV
jgi:hypothetical protein